MSEFNFDETIRQSAESVKRATLCPLHGKSPEFKLKGTSNGTSVEWSFCCDKLKEKVERKFVDETHEQMADAIARSIADAFGK